MGEAVWDVMGGEWAGYGGQGPFLRCLDINGRSHRPHRFLRFKMTSTSLSFSMRIRHSRLRNASMIAYNETRSWVCWGVHKPALSFPYLISRPCPRQAQRWTFQILPHLWH